MKSPHKFAFIRRCLAFFCLALGAPALQAATFTVTTNKDEFHTPSGLSLSLREALRDAAAAAGADTIVFDPSLSGQTILLGSQILVADTGGVTVDATALPIGLTLAPSSSDYRALELTAGGILSLHALTLSGFKYEVSLVGGCIRNSGTLSLTRCTLTGNHADAGGGAIFNASGTASLAQCTLSGNSSDLGGAVCIVGGTLIMTECTLSGGFAATSGGAIFNSSGTVILTRCTLSDNNAYSAGGAIYSDSAPSPAPTATLTLTHCTLSGNRVESGGGGGIHNALATLSMTNSIVAGNFSSASTPDISSIGTFNRSGVNMVGNLTGTGQTASATLLTGSPNLAALGNYGGPTLTRPPLAGSPAIDKAAALVPAITADQRGVPILDGDGNGSILPDLGATEAGVTRRVTHTGDSGTGSLRQTLADAAAAAGPDIIGFASALSGQSIALASQISLADSGGVVVDATALPGGLTLTPSASGHRALNLPSGSLVLRGLTLSGFSSGSQNGGVISSEGSLALFRCTFSGNSARFGGAINTNFGTLTMEHCTFSGNSASSSGGAISWFAGPLTMTHCTFSGNAASSNGGAIYIFTNKVTITNTIIAGNTAPLGPDIGNSGIPIIEHGDNLVGNLAGSGLTPNVNLRTGSPMLAPLGRYGGPTPTMPPLSGSPAIDAAEELVPAITADQRGIPILDGDGDGSIVPDLGATEAGVTRLVTHTGNTGTGSLRQALADAAAVASPDIIGFAPALSGQSIALASQVTIADSVGVIIDATSLPAGITLTDTGVVSHRLFQTGNSSLVTFRGITFKDGGGLNTSDPGAAIHSVTQAAVVVERCTFTGNRCILGGAIYNELGAGPMTLLHCTFSGNSTPTSEGGAIFNHGSIMRLTHCTVSGNTAGANGGISGGIINYLGTLTLANCITRNPKFSARQSVPCFGTQGLAVRSGLHPKMLPRGPKALAGQMMVPNGGDQLRISGSRQP
jgi:predicted outer membrane repeat protein